jgi:hypothetical protein
MNKCLFTFQGTKFVLNLLVKGEAMLFTNPVSLYFPSVYLFLAACDGGGRFVKFVKSGLEREKKKVYEVFH